MSEWFSVYIGIGGVSMNGSKVATDCVCGASFVGVNGVNTCSSCVAGRYCPGEFIHSCTDYIYIYVCMCII